MKNYFKLILEKQKRIEKMKEEIKELDLEIEQINIEVKQIDEICKKHIPYGYDINQDKSNYIRKERTVSDRIKYGEVDLPDELIGMTDQYSSFEDHVNILRKDQFD